MLYTLATDLFNDTKHPRGLSATAELPVRSVYRGNAAVALTHRLRAA